MNTAAIQPAAVPAPAAAPLEPQAPARRKRRVGGGLTVPQLGVDREVAARMVGVGASLFQNMVADGRMPRPKAAGNRSIWLVTELQAALEALPESNHLPPAKAPAAGAALPTVHTPKPRALR